ncbi:MAG: ferredoxin-NADP reductase [Bacteroidota bacterium]
MDKFSVDSLEPQFLAKVLKSERITPDNIEEIREVTLQVDDPKFTCDLNECFGVVVEEPGKDHVQHHRLYNVADIPSDGVHNQFTFQVKRCNYIDSFSGEEVQGITSNYLCSRKKGDEITITGPYPLPFKIPEDHHSNLILIGLGTGISPFRAFMKHLHSKVKNWQGTIRLFYGSKNGLELIYTNDEERDLAQYYDQKTYNAFQDLSPRPYWMDSFTNDSNIEERAEEILDTLWQSDTYIYVAGHKRIMENLETAFSAILGSKVKWAIRKADLIRSGKWVELLY